MIEVSLANKITKSNATRDLIDSGSDNGKIQFFGGTRAGIDTSPSSTLLAEITLTKPCGTADAQGLHLTQNAVGQILSAGVITWARVVDSDNSPVFSGDVLPVGDPNASSADFVIDQTDVFTGALINLLSATLQEGG